MFPLLNDLLWPQKLVPLTHVVANNGWVWDADPLVDFAGPTSRVYLRRELIVWADCVKLRYGRCANDNQWLWSYMEEYTRLMASMFHAFRIDNCHSTPIHVAQHLLDVARQTNPNLYVIAELFTGSEQRDLEFVCQMGINSLIREAMTAWDARELSRLIHRHGGTPVGSLSTELNSVATSLSTAELSGDESVSTAAELVCDLKPARPHALFVDCTHDNESAAQKRTAEDTLSTSALVAMTACAVGSVRGYDELFLERLDLVKERRYYQVAAMHTGIYPAKAVLLQLHQHMAAEGYQEVHVHEEDGLIHVHRQHPLTHDGYLLIAHTGFAQRERPPSGSWFRVRAALDRVMLSARLKASGATDLSDAKTLRGVDGNMEIRMDGVLPGMCTVTCGQDAQGAFFDVQLEQFPSGSVLLVHTCLDPQTAGHLRGLYQSMNLKLTGGWCFDCVNRLPIPALETAASALSLEAANLILFSCEPEEQDRTGGGGCYGISGMDPMFYAGLYGFHSVLRAICPTNDLGHPMCGNLRQGGWAMDFIVERLRRLEHAEALLEDTKESRTALRSLAEWFSSQFQFLKTLPPPLVPKYFSVIVETAYDRLKASALNRLAPFVRDGSEFRRQIGIGSVALTGIVRSSALVAGNANKPSVAAGLPHFATGYLRCWGRDTFIALPGLLCLTGRFELAREHIVAFARCLRHGLIPNLLDSGNRPRYNCRDAAWWFLQAIQSYCESSPDGYAILKILVPMRFPKDVYEDFDPAAKPETRTLESIIQEIMQRHASGIHFREHNAGSAIDDRMRDAGFQVDIRTDVHGTGFIFGGNASNCGTWMDKMGESERAGNRGVPATPRDGADVEIIGLLKSTLRWLTHAHSRGLFTHQGVEIPGLVQNCVDHRKLT